VDFREASLPDHVMDLIRSDIDDCGLHAVTSGLGRLSQIMKVPAGSLSRRRAAKIRASRLTFEDIAEMCVVAKEHLREYLPAAIEAAHIREEDPSQPPAVSPRTLSTLMWSMSKLGCVLVAGNALSHGEAPACLVPACLFVDAAFIMRFHMCAHDVGVSRCRFDDKKAYNLVLRHARLTGLDRCVCVGPPTAQLWQRLFVWRMSVKRSRRVGVGVGICVGVGCSVCWIPPTDSRESI